MPDEMGTQLFIKLSTEEKKRKFKTKCSGENVSMTEILEKAVDEFLEKGKKAGFLK